MSKRPGEDPIQPEEIAMQVDYDLARAGEFAADIMEAVNDHNIAAALRAIDAEEYDLACEFIQLEKKQADAGELTPALDVVRQQLLKRLKRAIKDAQ